MEPLVAYLAPPRDRPDLGRSRRRDGGLPALARGRTGAAAAAPGHLLLLGGLAGAGDGSASALLLREGGGFYLPNPFFVTKMALYIAIAALSIKPTVPSCAGAGGSRESGELPPAQEIVTARRLIHVEVALLALMPLMAVLMARGIGR